MPQYTICGYNIEWMNNLFSNNQIKSDEQARATAIADVIERIDPHVLAICEAANSDQEHKHFIDNFLGGRYEVVIGASRGAQNLVFYIRPPFELDSVDADADFYEPWTVDVDDDGVTEQFRFERRPLEATFRIGTHANAQRVRFILVHTKSKGVFDVVDLAGFRNRSLGNRKKLAAQARKLRERLDSYLGASQIPTIVLGDFNDGPGLDAEEKVLGRSFVETVMGAVFDPGRVLHNTLYHIATGDRWTADFPDPIVSNPRNWKHRVWIDHILVSPDMLQPNAALRLVNDSGAIDQRDQTSRTASDHFAVSCTLMDE